MEKTKAKIVREKTGAAMPVILKYMKMFPKANIEDIIEIVREEGFAIYHKISIEERFKHLK